MNEQTPGHDPGHRPGIRWHDLVSALSEMYGGLPGLADELVRRVPARGRLQRDSLIKGLRRLRDQAPQDGGVYGRDLLRHFGLPINIQRWLMYLGQYHSRFADLPTGMRLEQLRLWEHPPITRSVHVAWLHLGYASALLRQDDRTESTIRLEMARARAAAAGPAAQIEAQLLGAWLDYLDADLSMANERLGAVPALLTDPALSPGDRHDYVARLQGQRAQLRALSGKEVDIRAALSLIEEIPADTGRAFVDFRRSEGRALYHQKLGEHEQARVLARAAMEHAADGGFVRFRILAMRVLARSLPEPERTHVRDRAQRLAASLEDDDLVRRARW